MVGTLSWYWGHFSNAATRYLDAKFASRSSFSTFEDDECEVSEVDKTNREKYLDEALANLRVLARGLKDANVLKRLTIVIKTISDIKALQVALDYLNVGDKFKYRVSVQTKYPHYLEIRRVARESHIFLCNEDGYSSTYSMEVVRGHMGRKGYMCSRIPHSGDVPNHHGDHYTESAENNLPKGIINRGNSCYLVAIAQILLKFEDLREKYLNLIVEDAGYASCLQQLYKAEQEQKDQNVLDLHIFFHRVRTLCKFSYGQQNDAREVYEQLLQGLQGEDLDGDGFKSIDVLFGCPISCLRCHKSDSFLASRCCIRVQVEFNTGLQLEDLSIMMSKLKKCSTCSSGECRMIMVPEYLGIILDRNLNDIKKCGHIKFTEQIDLQDYLKVHFLMGVSTPY